MSKKQSLLDQATQIKSKRRTKNTYSAEEEELALAWCANEVGIQQISKLMGWQGPQTYCFLAQVLRQFISKNGLK